jgi:hypothetical protein
MGSADNAGVGLMLADDAGVGLMLADDAGVGLMLADDIPTEPQGVMLALAALGRLLPRC